MKYISPFTIHKISLILWFNSTNLQCVELGMDFFIQNIRTLQQTTLNVSLVGNTFTSTPTIYKCMTFEVSLGFKQEIPIESHEAMVTRQRSLDINKFPCFSTSMITIFMKYCLKSTYEKLLEIRIQGIYVRSEKNPSELASFHSIKILCSFIFSQRIHT